MTETASSSRVRPIGRKETDHQRIGKKASISIFIAFASFMVLITILYLANRSSWKGEITQQQVLIDSLKNHSQELHHRLEFIKTAEEARTTSISDHTFDSFDANNYRVYGLYRDMSKKLTREEMANRFNVFNAGAIKYTDIVGERWFVIPVKGVHFMQEDDTLAEIAIKYYGSEKDSVLISAFNKNIEPYRHIFIPFNE